MGYSALKEGNDIVAANCCYCLSGGFLHLSNVMWSLIRAHATTVSAKYAA